MGLDGMSMAGFQGSACVSEANDGGEPRVAPPASNVRFEHRCPDQFDPPPIAECAANLTLRHPPRPPFSGFPLTEAHHVVRAAFPKYRHEASHEDRAVLLGKHGEEGGGDPTVGPRGG